MTELAPDAGMDPVPSGDQGVSIGQQDREAQYPFEVRLADETPLYWALLDGQEDLDHGPGVIDRRDAQNAQTLLRRAAEIDNDAVMACAGQTRAAARTALLGILARDRAS